jgi:phospholipid/cholesterol/gamma-HCH transport system substrate-binding protein
MKINNETKIGMMAIVGILLLIFGFNYLKGKKLFKKERLIYASYSDVLGLSKSNPVVINGLRVGRVENLDGGRDMKRIVVTISLSKDIDIPSNSLGVINPNLLGSPSLEIQLGNATTYLKNGDSLLTTMSTGAFDEALKLINPVLYEVKTAVTSLDSVLHTVTGVFDADTKKNIRGVFANLNVTTASLAISTASLQQLLNSKSGALTGSLNNLDSFTANLKSNNERLSAILVNTQKASSKFAELDLKKTLDTLHSAIENFKEVAQKINSKNGSLGLLINDKQLYKNLESTTNKINILLDDIRVHPKRYVNFSVFGKRDKGNYISAPLIDDTLKVAK